MSRIVKQPEERIMEIISAAKELFSSKGYEKTTVNDIILKIGVAKGTFYHYFKSKEQIADAVTRDAIESCVESLQQIRSNIELKAPEKFMNIVQSIYQVVAKHYEDGLMAFLHHEDNVLLHHKMKVGMIKEFVPLISDVIRQGVEEDVFHTDFPVETTEFLLIGLHFMFDPSFFTWTPEEFLKKLDAIVEIYERLLGAPKGTFPLIKGYLEKLHLQV